MNNDNDSQLTFFDEINSAIITHVPKDIDADLIRQRKNVYFAFKDHGACGASDNEVSRLLKIPAAQVSARRNELIQARLMEAVLEDGHRKKRKDQYTRQPNTLWKVK